LSSALLRITVKRELRNDKNPSADIGEREVHLVVCIGEHSEAEYFFGHPFHLRERVGGGESDEDEKAAADSACDPFRNTDLRTRDPLEQNAQTLLDRYRLGEVARLVDVRPALDRDVVG